MLHSSRGQGPTSPICHVQEVVCPTVESGVILMCNCEFTVDPDDIEDDWHFDRVCKHCGRQWRGLHCPHDGYQNPCPECGIKPEREA